MRHVMHGRDEAYKIFRKFEAKRPLGRPRHGVRTWSGFI
jgi:hypothetical protein